MKNLFLLLGLAAGIFGLPSECLAQENPNVIFEEMFDGYAEVGGNDGVWNDYSGALVKAPEGWTFEQVIPACQCVLVGNSRTLGSITTPPLDVDGEVTITFRAGAWDWGKEKNTLRISSSAGTLSSKSVKLEKGHFNDYALTLKYTGANRPRITFTGESKNGASRFFLDDVRVFPENVVPTKIAPEIAFAKPDDEISLAQQTYTLQLTNAEGLPLTFSSSNENVATVDVGGQVSLVAGGNTTITALFDGNEEYSAASATLDLNVLDGTNVMEKLVPLASKKEVDSGERYYLIAEKEGEYYAMKAELVSGKTSGKLQSENITKDPSALDDDNLFYFTGDISNKVVLETNDYVKLYSKGNDFHTSSSNRRWMLDDAETEGQVALHSEQPVANYVSLNSNNQFGAFSSYKEIAYLYKPCAAKIAIKTQEGYGTIYTDEPFVMPEGVKGSTVRGVNLKTGELELPWEYSAGDVIPAQTGLLTYADRGGIYICYAPQADAVSVRRLSADDDERPNLLSGTTAMQLIPEQEGVWYYKLAYDDSNVLGFYWGENDGAPFLNAAHRAYLALTAEEAENTTGFRISKPSTSSIELTPHSPISAENLEVFTLAGMRLPVKSEQELRPGVYVVNGKKRIISR